MTTPFQMQLKRLCVFMSLALCTCFLTAQNSAPTILWDKTLGGNDMEDYDAIDTTSDGGTILVASTLSGISGNKTEANVGGVDIWVVKMSPNGAIEYQNTIGGSDTDIATSIHQTTDGGYIVGVYTQSPLSGDKSQANRGVGGFDNGDYWVIKLRPDLTIEWEKSIGGTGNDWLEEVRQTTDGGFILAGYSDSPVSGEKTVARIGSTDYWVVKLDATGLIQWQNVYGTTSYDNITAVQQTSDGGYILAGSVATPAASGLTQYGGYDYYVLKITASGAFEWAKTFGGSADDFLMDIKETANGYIMGGYSESNASGVKSETRLGNYGDYWVIRTDLQGNIQWENTIGGNNMDYFRTLVLTPDGGYILGGHSFSTPSFDKSSPQIGNGDYWIVKINSAGVVQWEKSIGGTGMELLETMALRADGTLYLQGGSESNISGDKTANSFGSSDVWVVKLGPAPASTTPSVFDAFFCQNAAATPLNATGQNLLWYTSAVGGVGSTTAPTPSTTTIGTTYFYVSQTVNGVESARSQIKVTVNGLPIISITGNSTVCNTNTWVYLSGSGGVNYSWSTGSQYPNIYVNPTATTTYSVVGTDINGCVGTASKTVTLNSFTPTVSGPNNICRYSSATLTATGGTYLWSTGQTTASITVSPTATTTYRVTVTNNGCSQILTKNLVVNVPTSVQITGLANQYPKNAAPVTLTGTPAGGVFRIDNVVATVFNPATLSVGNHVVRYTTVQGACTVFNSKHVQVTAPVQNLIGSAPTLLSFEGRAELNKIRLEWVNQNGDANDYYVVQKLNELGEFTDLTTLNAGAQATNLAAFTTYDAQPNDGENQYRIKTVSSNGATQISAIKTLIFNKLENLKAFPNPATDYVDINLENYVGKSVDMRLYNQFGQAVLNQSVENVSNAMQRFELKDLQTGNYVLRVSSKGKRDGIVKFIVGK